MLISLVVPVYNCQETICRTIDSIIFQLDDNSELIIINDGSVDKTNEIIKNKIKNTKKNIKYISKDNEGLIKTRYRGYCEASGMYIFNVDGGDEIKKNAISILEKEIKKDKMEIDYYVINNLVRKNDKEFYREYDGNKINSVKDLLLGCCPYSICFKIAKREYLLKSNIVNENKKITSGEDLCFSFDLMVNTNSGKLIDDYLYIYNVEEDSMSTKDDDINFLIAIDYVKKEINRLNLDLKEELDYMIFSKTITEILLYKKINNYNCLFRYFTNSNINRNNKYIKFYWIQVLISKLKVKIYGK